MKTSNTKKLQKLKNQIKNGTYVINPERIARKIIADSFGPLKPLP
jgi:anti-sigma28 factor (negative regulator of flagellin synthesis)